MYEPIFSINNRVVLPLNTTNKTAKITARANKNNIIKSTNK